VLTFKEKKNPCPTVRQLLFNLMLFLPDIIIIKSRSNMTKQYLAVLCRFDRFDEKETYFLSFELIVIFFSFKVCK